MILYPPERFDLNEWFTIASVVLPMSIALLLPRRFSPIAITVFVVFTLFMSQSVDSLIAVKPFDMYDVSDSSKYEIMDIVIYYLSYPPVMYIYLYVYDKWKWKGMYRIYYVIGASLLTTFMEWLAHICHVFTYKGWKIWYSPFVYIGVYVLYIFLYHLTQKWLSEGLGKTGESS